MAAKRIPLSNLPSFVSVKPALRALTKEVSSPQHIIGSSLELAVFRCCFLSFPTRGGDMFFHDSQTPHMVAGSCCMDGFFSLCRRASSRNHMAY